MDQSLRDRLTGDLERARADRIWKTFQHLDGPQGARASLEGRGEVLILSSNNYLGFSNLPSIVEAGKQALDRWGTGTASVRFICGSFTVHRELEESLARLVGTEAALTYVSAWTANAALLPTLLDENDVILSDALNHASIIDATRLARAQRRVYAHSDMADLETALKESARARTRLIISDGVFSMDGDIARLPDIVELARRYDAVVALDDSHATGVLGATGRGTAEHFGLLGEVDVIVSTLGKALGGAAGGFVAASTPVIEYLKQFSRPQIFSNALPPAVAAGAIAAIRALEAEPERVTRLGENARYFRERLAEIGLPPVPGETPIVPIVLGRTERAIRMSELLLEEGVFVTGFGFPVVSRGQARIRCQISAAHTREDLDEAVAAIRKVGTHLGLLS